MRKAIRKLLPHPLLSILLTIVWIVLQNSFSTGMVVFGIILGIILPLITKGWWPDRPVGFRIGRMIGYCVVVIWDILVANVEVAWIVLTKPNSRLRSTWIIVPLDLRQPEAITILAGTITLTPGTVSSDFSSDGHSLLVHVLHTDDLDGVRDTIKSRYEHRLKEIFV